MIYATRVYHRQDTNIEWYNQSSEYADHLKKNFLDTKKILNVMHEESSDEFSMISLTVFADMDAKLEFENDDVCVKHMADREVYNDDNCIFSEKPIILQK
jgi:hypothetical protein